ncbi:MAG TPA: hypothetical protein VGS97_08330 [Actinocrinis sp.]|uniref:transmembrane-type terpene cyclase n=1 Tax=Actinocrinis sp. TaxID=1920516 RepID=UPI002DDC91E1|nr:hypothetical protein [Actinocrinis sp.]HEV2344084.1 hypothetical protein [Actinocrinis sp.]
MSTALAVGTGLCWTLAYLLIIRVGLRERTYGMPLVAFAANLSWEFIYAFVHPSNGVQHVINVVWFLLDCVIGYTVVRFGPSEFPYLPRRVFYGCLVALLAFTYPAVYLVGTQFDAGDGVLSAFMMNLMMSALFIAMFMARQAGRGQSVGIATAKLAGTAFASGSLAVKGDLAARYHGGLLPYLYIAIFVLDLVYLGLVLSVRAVPVSSAAAEPITGVTIYERADVDSR